MEDVKDEIVSKSKKETQIVLSNNSKKKNKKKMKYLTNLMLLYAHARIIELR